MVGYSAPNNDVLVAGSPFIQELKVHTATNVKAGRLVEKGSAASQIVACSVGGNPIGVVGWNPHSAYKPATLATDYAANSFAPVMNGPMIVVLTLVTDSVVKGDFLIAGANGKVRKAAAVTATVPAGETTVTSTSAQPAITLVGSFPEDGLIVAQAEEDQNATEGDKAIIARWLL
ncbi:MAG: hypothetical protein V1857_06265 [archaeon]